jgi:hypothetical protein
MMDMSLQAIPATAGVNLEMIAQQNQQQPGVLEMQRKQQGMTVLAYIFDAKRRYQKEQGRLMIWMLQTFISDGRLIRIGGQENAKYVPFIRNPGLAEYDVIVDDAPTSPNMKERVWAMLMQMFPMLAKMALPPPVFMELFTYSPLPASLLAKIKEMMQSSPPPSPEMQFKHSIAQAQADRHQAEAERTRAETQKMTLELQGNLEEQKARIEKIRADAINSLQNAGITADDARFQQAKAAIDMLLRGVDMNHNQTMDMAQHALDVHQATQPPMAPAGPPQPQLPPQ